MIFSIFSATHTLSVLMVLGFTAPQADDSALAGDVKLSADQFAAAVLSSNPTVPMLLAAWQTVRAGSEQVRALNDPMLSVLIAPLTAASDQPNFGFGFELSQKFPWPGKRRLRGEAAARDADAVQESVEALRLRLAASAKTIAADGYWIHEAIETNRLDRDLLDEFRAIAETRYAAGSAGRQDALRAEMALRRSEHRKIQLESDCVALLPVPIRC